MILSPLLSEPVTEPPAKFRIRWTMPALSVSDAWRHQVQVYSPSGLVVVTAGVLVVVGCGCSVEATHPRLSSSTANGAQVRDSVGAEAHSAANACFCAYVDVLEVPSAATNSP